jgi:hypothetical protein
LALEQQVRSTGTGLVCIDLIGCWQLELVWPKGSQRASVFSGWLLRGLSARLEIQGGSERLLLSNAVNLGPIELRFRGPGCLQGKRPLLQFSFDQLQINVAARMPFFALIHRDSTGWLAARGRGGGLALWRLASTAPTAG